MAEKDFTILIKAEEPAEHTLRITSNCNHYPKKYRHSLVDKMQNKSLDIYTTLYEANRISHGNCKTLAKNTDEKIKTILEGAKDEDQENNKPLQADRARYNL